MSLGLLVLYGFLMLEPSEGPPQRTAPRLDSRKRFRLLRNRAYRHAFCFGLGCDWRLSASLTSYRVLAYNGVGVSCGKAVSDFLRIEG